MRPKGRVWVLSAGCPRQFKGCLEPWSWRSAHPTPHCPALTSRGQNTGRTKPREDQHAEFLLSSVQGQQPGLGICPQPRATGTETLMTNSIRDRTCEDTLAGASLGEQGIHSPPRAGSWSWEGGRAGSADVTGLQQGVVGTGGHRPGAGGGQVGTGEAR